MKVALISMPWAGPYRPSLQLGTLWSHVKAKKPSVDVSCFNYFLRIVDYIDYPLVRDFSDGKYSAWAIEAISTYFLFPEEREKILRYLQSRLTAHCKSIDLFKDILDPYQAFIDDLTAVPWKEFDLIGFSVSLCQTFSSILATRKLRLCAPEVPIIFGGPAVTGPIGQSLLHQFPEIDYIVNGEGEGPLIHIVEQLERGIKNLEDLPAVVSARTPSHKLAETIEIKDLDTLPLPNYDSYFRDLKQSSETRIYRDVEIPVEGSRGCWWDRSKRNPKLSCQFCNLNLQWKGYREKSVDRHVMEIDTLSKTYGVNRLLFVDNILRFKNAEGLFRGLIALGRPFRITLEARAHISDALLDLMKRCGVESVQIGIESLSSTTLKRINKGTTAIQNLEVMKHMERVGIVNPANIIYDLPDMTKEEIEETIAAVDYASAYYPLHPVPFLLQYGSPYSTFHDRDGVVQKNHSAWSEVVPQEMMQEVFFAEKELKVQSHSLSRDLTTRLVQRLAQWRQDYFEKKSAFKVAHLLYRERNEGRITIHDYRPATPLAFELHEQETQVYDFFYHHQSRQAAYNVLRDSVSSSEIDHMITNFQDHKLMFVDERDSVLSLAV